MGASLAVADVNDPLFETAHSAMVFALNFTSQNYERPTMNKLAAPGFGSGKGLIGLDGAGQAGMIRAEMASLGRLAECILIARVAPRTTPCSCRSHCCSGHRINAEWTAAISYLADYVRTTALSGCTAHGGLRREYVVRYFTRKDDRTNIEAIAERYDIARNTASAHCAKVFQFFGGTPAHGAKQPVPGLEAIAQEAIEDKLRNIGMVGVAM